MRNYKACPYEPFTFAQDDEGTLHPSDEDTLSFLEFMGNCLHSTKNPTLLLDSLHFISLTDFGYGSPLRSSEAFEIYIQNTETPSPKKGNY